MLRLRLLALLLSLGLSASTWGQENSDAVPGQDAIAGINDLGEAIDLLWASPISEEEIADFHFTMTSLTAWARPHQYQCMGMFESYPLLEAVRGLTYWEEIGLSPEPFVTTLSKLTLLSNNVDPEFDGRVRATEYLDYHLATLEAGEVLEEDMEMVLEGIAMAKEHLVQIDSIPEGNRSLYLNDLEKIDFQLANLPSMGSLEETPSTGLQLSAEGVQMFSSGTWVRSPYDIRPLFSLDDSTCYVGIYSAPWYEEDSLNDDMINQIVETVSPEDSSFEIKERIPGEIDGWPNYRLDFGLVGENQPLGRIYVTHRSDVMHILIFRFDENEQALLQPILEEFCATLQPGNFPPPLLLDRTDVGYQIFAEEPWKKNDVSPEFADRSLSFGELPFFLDIAIVEDVQFGLEEFEAALPALANITRERFIDGVITEPRLIEVDGEPCAIIHGNGDPHQGAEVFDGARETGADYYILHGDRIVHFGIIALHEQWNEIGPLVEELVLNTKLTQVIELAEIAPAVGPTSFFLDRSEVGYQVSALSPWTMDFGTYEDSDRTLIYGDIPSLCAIMVFDSKGMEIESMPTFTDYMKDLSSKSFINPTALDNRTLEIDGRTCFVVESFGSPKEEFALFDSDEQRHRQYMVLNGDYIIVINFSAPQENWELMAPLMEALAMDMQFPEVTPPAPLFLDRSDLGYQVYAGDEWTINEGDPGDSDDSIACESLGCYVDFSVVDNPIAREDFESLTQYIHSESLRGYIDGYSVKSEVIEFDGRLCGVSEIHGICNEEGDYPGTNLHALQVFPYYENQLLLISIRTETADWDAALPTIIELIADMKFPDVP